MEQIIVSIAADATFTVAVKGVKGRSCTEVTKAIEQISQGATDTKKTGEYYQVSAGNNAHVGRGG